MQSSDLPTKISVPFAEFAANQYARDIPVASQVAVTPGAASFETGFPPVNFMHPKNGGIPCSGADFNGLLRMITSWQRWQAAGGPAIYDAEFQAEITGYPMGARVSSATTPGKSYYNTVDNNITNPDTGGLGWQAQQDGSSGANGSTPLWGIIMWPLPIADIPSNYHLCDGTNGTPDMRDRFVVGAGGSYAQGQVGGSVTQTGGTDAQGVHSHGGSTAGHQLSQAEMPSHIHGASTDSQGEHAHTYHTGTGEATSTSGAPANAQNPGPYQTLLTDPAGAHVHTVTIASTGGDVPHAHGVNADGSHAHNVAIPDGRPPFIGIAYIQRIA